MAKKKITRPKQYVSKEQRAKQKPKEPMSKQLKYGLIIGGAVVVLALVLFLIFYNDGSLPMQDGEVVMGADNWIVVNTGTSSKPKYYKIAEIEPAEGYVAEESETSATTPGFQNFVATDPENPVSRYYVMGVNGKAGEVVESANTSYLAMLGDAMKVSGTEMVDVDGREAYYFTTEVIPAEEGEETEEGTGYDLDHEQQMVCYFPAIRNTTVLAVVVSDLSDGKEPLTEAELVAAMSEVVANITFEEK